MKKGTVVSYPFEKLEAWNASMTFASDVYQASKSFPNEAQFGLGEQLRRASTSIPLNIAEGAGRHHDKEFLRFLRIARGSLYEVVTNLRLCRLLGYLSEQQYMRLYQESNRVCKLINGFIRSFMV